MTSLTNRPNRNSVTRRFGAIPSHWVDGRLKNVMKVPVTDGPHTTPEFVAEGVPFLSVDAIQFGELTFEATRFVSESDATEFRSKAAPRRGDLLMGKAASTGKIAQVKTDLRFCIWSPLALIRIAPQRANPSFIEYLLKSTPAQAQIEDFCTSNTQKNISMADIQRLSILVPPLDEQRQIAEYLDRETGKIDELITKQEQLVATLAERRKTVISWAVSCGIRNSAARTSEESGKFPTLPTGWSAKRLKHLGTIKYGIGEPPRYVNDGVRMIRATNVSIGRITPENMVYVDPNDIPSSRIFWLRSGDIIVVRSGALTGDSAMIDDSVAGSIAGFDMVFRPASMVIPKFIQYVLLSTYVKESQLDIARMRAAQPHLNAEELGNVLVLTPSIEEQLEIVRYLDEHVQKTDSLTSAAGSVVRLLRERRAALISAAVTGKIDVRGL